LWEEPDRRPVPSRVKRIIYERAKGKCQKCKIPLEIDEGDFHHKGKPTSTRPSSIVFLCPNCHRKYGHEYKTVKRETIWGVEKERRIVRQRVVRKKPQKYRRKAIRGPFGDVIGYRTIKIRKPKRKTKKTQKRR
jgi:5-methylcytosine-specific restriction endonuclease McrA